MSERDPSVRVSKQKDAIDAAIESNPMLCVPVDPSPKGATPSDVELVRRKTKWGVHLARIGAVFPFVIQGGAKDEYGDPVDLGVMRHVHDAKGRLGGSLRARCVCLTANCGITADTREQLEAAHRDKFGDAKTMAARGVRHVWAYEGIDNFKHPERSWSRETNNAERITVDEVAPLFSDRSITDE